MPCFMPARLGRARGADVDEPHERVGRRQLLEQAPRLVGRSSSTRVAAGGHGDRADADGVGALDVVRRVADDEHVVSATGPACRASASARAAIVARSPVSSANAPSGKKSKSP